VSSQAPLLTREPPSKNGVWLSVAAIAAAVFATAAELCIAAAGVLNLAPILALVAAHVGVGVALGLCLVPLSARHRGNPVFLLFMICILAMGPLGPLGTGVTMVLRRIFARRATPFEEWYLALFPRITMTRTAILYERIVLRGGGPPKRSTVAPFQDIMTLGTVQQKQAVIGMIADGFSPVFAPALQSALNDPEPAIRVQAATAFARVEGRFLNRSMTLEASRAERPDDIDVILELARHHEECAESGLLDDGRTQVELAEALVCCERADALRPGDRLIAEAVARLLLRLGRPADAMLRLQSLAARSEASPEVLASYVVCLFRQGQFERLREVCRRSCRSIDLVAHPKGIGEAVRLWSDDAARQAAPRTVAAIAPT
jgi:polysaccharide biosynthesis protein PelE